MTTTDARDSPAPSAAMLLVREVIIVFGFALLLTTLAHFAHPVWDDGWWDLFSEMGTPASAVFADRPVFGAILAWTAEHKLAAYVTHTVAWFGAGLTALLVWSALFPERPHARLAAGIVAMSPLICVYQMVLVCGVFYLIQVEVVVLACAVIYVRLAAHPTATRTNFLTVLAAGLAICGMVQITEYAVPATVAALPLLWILLGRRGVSAKTRSAAVIWMIVCAVGGYAVYWLVGDAAARPDVRPEGYLTNKRFPAHLLPISKNLLADVWQLSLGSVLNHLAALKNALSAGWIIALAGGVLGGVTLFWNARRYPAPQRELRVSSAEMISAATLLFGIIIAVLPVVLMDRLGSNNKMDTRFWFPVLPLGAVLTTFIFTTLVREQLTLFAVTLLGFMGGFTTAGESGNEIRTRQQAREYGRQLSARLSPAGVNVAFFMFGRPDHTKSIPSEQAYELSARITAEWPREARNRFWAWVGPMDTPPAEIALYIRGVARAGAVTKVFAVNVDAYGSVRSIVEHTPPGADAQPTVSASTSP